MPSKVFMICVAYEQGMGSGLQRNGVSNPYAKAAAEEHEAWSVGYSEGEDIANRAEKEERDFPEEKAAIVREVFAEIDRATAKFPLWPTDPLHALAVLGEEYGELTKAVLQHVYEPDKATREDVREEAIQTAAMALRFVISLGAYIYMPQMQHQQHPNCFLPKVPT